MRYSLYPVWPTDAPKRHFDFKQKILRANWPNKYPELERSIQTLALTLFEAISTFRGTCRRKRWRIKNDIVL